MSRWRKGVRRAAVALLALAVAVVLLATALLHSLDHPSIKRRIVAAVYDAAGLDVDYQSVRVSLLSGLEVDAVVVRSPSSLRDVAPDLAHIGRIEVGWSVASLRGKGPPLERVAVKDVVLAVVVDEHGRTSFDAIGPATPPPAAKPAPPTAPLSRVVAQALASPPPATSVELSNVAATLVETREGHVVGKTLLSGVGARVKVEAAAEGWRVRVDLGTPEAPLDLRAVRDEEPNPWAAEVRVAIGADASPRSVGVRADVDVVEQTLAKELPLGHLLHVEARAAFDPKRRTTSVTVDGVTLAGGVGRVDEAAIDLPDEGPPLVRHAKGDVDLAKLLALDVTGLVPVHLATGELHYAFDGLILEAIPRVTDAGGLSIVANVGGASARAGDLEGTLDAADVTLRARPLAKGQVDVEGAAHLAAADLRVASARAEAAKVTLELKGSQAEDHAIEGTATLRFEALGAPGVVARKGEVGLRLGAVHVDPDTPLAARGELAVSADAASVDAAAGRSHVGVTGLRLLARTTLSGHAPYAATVDVHASRLAVGGAAGKLVDAPADVMVALEGARPDFGRPVQSTGVARIEATVGDVKASLSATKERDAVDFTLHLAAQTLGALRSLVPPEVARKAPLASMAVDVASQGRVEKIGGGAPRLDERTLVHLTRPAFGAARARSLTLVVATRGDAVRHALDADLRLEDLAIAGSSAKRDHVAVSAALDRDAETFRADVALDGRADAKVVATFGFDRARRALTYDVDGRLGQLGAIAALLPSHATGGLDLRDLGIELAARGALLGAVVDVGRSGRVVFEPNPAASLAAIGTLDFKAAHVHWSGGGRDVQVPSLSWHAELSAPEGKRALKGALSIPSAKIASGLHDFEIAGLEDATSLTVSGDLHRLVAQVTEGIRVETVKQDAAPYAVGGASLALEASRDQDGIIRVPKLDFTNSASGTALSLSGGIDLGEGRHRMSMRGKVQQDLSRLTGLPDVFAGDGDVGVELSVSSADMAVFHAQADVRLQGVGVRLPKAGIAVLGVEGELPLTLTIAADARGVSLLRNARLSPYSLLRFTDQHPMLSRSSYLSIASITTPFVAIAPLAGNFSVEDNIVSITQFDMGARGGRITGQCVFDFDGYNSTLGMHVRATDLLSSHGERFDGNAALVLSAGERTIEGRADIVRIGKRHLLDLLDLQDPLRTDPAMNRIRAALSIGYPDQVRLSFDHGFASAHVALGGLARLVRIDDLRGLPLGPIIDKYLGPLLPK